MYRYTESGLNNVWLANGYTVVPTPIMEFTYHGTKY